MPANTGEDWPRTLEEARLVQERLRGRIVTEDRFGALRRVAGVDVHYSKNEAVAFAAAVVFSLPELEPIEETIARSQVPFPYVSGYLSFREVPAALKALKRLENTPDLILCDGQGTAHPRRFGLACHLGLISEMTAVGVAKSRLVGEFDEPGPDKGAWTPLSRKGEVIGAVVRTRSRVRPVFVSPGHRIGLESAIRLVLACTTRYRLPEPLRLAHRLAAQAGG